jgi:carbon storage regulator
MLVLSRKLNEQIVIAENIVITVVEIRGDKIRLGIEAPKHVPVHRREVYDAIKKEEKEKGEKFSFRVKDRMFTIEPDLEERT